MMGIIDISLIYFWLIIAHLVPDFPALLKNGAKRACQLIEIETCRDLPYNFTSMPNLVGNDEQLEADMQLATFSPLIQVQCSSELKFFLCSLYVPMCTDKVDMAIGPCRPLCESVRRCCEPTLKQFGFAWPDSFNCSAFPAENNAQSMCMRGPGSMASSASCGSNRAASLHRTPHGGPPVSPNRLAPRLIPSDVILHPFAGGSKTHQMIPCDSHFFPQLQTTCASFLLFAMSAACAAASCVLLALEWTRSPNKYTAEHHRKPPPNLRGAVFLYATYCYGLGSLGPLLRLVVGRQTTGCVDHLGAQVLVANGLHNALCTVVAVLWFYFGAAAQIWLLIASILWLLRGPLRLDENLLNDQRFYMHMMAWMIPLVQTASVLANQAVDADLFTGVCTVGNGNPDALLKFVLLPQIIYLSGSSIVFLVGFYLRRCKLVHTRCQWTESLNKGPLPRCPHEDVKNSFTLEYSVYFSSGFCLLICNVLDLTLIKWRPADHHNISELSFALTLLKTSSSFAFGLMVGARYLFVAAVQIRNANPSNTTTYVTSPLFSINDEPSVTGGFSQAAPRASQYSSAWRHHRKPK